jgi:hypothetical protein
MLIAAFQESCVPIFVHILLEFCVAIRGATAKNGYYTTVCDCSALDTNYQQILHGRWHKGYQWYPVGHLLEKAGFLFDMLRFFGDLYIKMVYLDHFSLLTLQNKSSMGGIHIQDLIVLFHF